MTEIGSLPRSLAVGQFNDDDHLDVAIAHENGYSDVYVNDNQVSIYLGKGDGTFQSAKYVAAGDSPVAIVTGQFNDDNHDGWINDRDALDLAVANAASNDVTVLINNGTGTFNTGVDILASDSQTALRSALLRRISIAMVTSIWPWPTWRPTASPFLSMPAMGRSCVFPMPSLPALEFKP